MNRNKNNSERNAIKSQFMQLKTREDVAQLLEISDKSLRYFLYKRRPENMYHSFDIPKRNGASRRISAPYPELKIIQRKLACVLATVYEPKSCAYGFIEGKRMVDGAACHVKQRLVLNIDLKDFFSQIHFGRVRGMLMKPPYEIGKEAATTIAQIACLNGRLPQGAPSSPIITNMVCVPLDNALMSLAKEKNCFYTRYADDITFSTHEKMFSRAIAYVEDNQLYIGNKLSSILDKHSFQVNPEKVSLRPCTLRQEVTGLTVNEFPNVRRSYLKQLRAILHSCEKFGVIAAAKVYVEKGLCENRSIINIIDDPDSESKIEEWFKNVLKGKINYIRQVKGSTNYTYLTFARELNEIFAESIFDVPELENFDFEKFATNSVFLLKYKHGEDNIQGSAFYVAGVGILTSYHVTDKEENAKASGGDIYIEVSKVKKINQYH